MAEEGKQTSEFALLDRNVDVVIVGNGPSSIALSYLLSGYRPYWNGQAHPNEYLAPKLAASPNQSILDQDLEYLAEGLSGRSSNPISLLFDQLLLPDADFGSRLPPVVSWRHHKELAIDHLVLGRGCVGGSWAKMPADLQSLSYAQWLQLPDMPVVDFLSQITKTENSGLDRGVCGIIAHYYQQYVRHKSLYSHFLCGAEVMDVRRLDSTDEERPSCTSASILQHCHCCVSPLSTSCCESSSPEQELQDAATSSPLRSAYLTSSTEASGRCGCMSSSDDSITSVSTGDSCVLPSPLSTSPSCSSTSSLDEPINDLLSSPRADVSPSLQDYHWSICGHRACKPFRYRAKYVVVAVGTSDEPRRLNVPGESLDVLSYGCPSPEALRAIASSVSLERPLIVVGCGLTAADTVLLALQQSLPVVHVFGRAVSDTSLVVNRMPESVYPEYARVGKLMQTHVAAPDKPLVFDIKEPYLSLQGHHVISVAPHSCSLQSSDGHEISLPCSHVFVAAGSRPNLSFLPQSGQNLAYEPGADFDCHVNPVDVDPISFESSRIPGLYAMGPLVGDNFVRFAIGGSLGITKSLSAKLLR